MKTDKVDNKTVFFLIVILSFLLYGNTLFHDYTLDDSIVIKNNTYTKSGLKGIWNILSRDAFAGYDLGIDNAGMNDLSGGRYRPLSIVTFAIEYALWDEYPQFSHYLNVLFYSFTVFLCFLILSKWFPFSPHTIKYFSMPVVATLIFLCHPVHTEVVANIKGRDEILAFLFSMIALYMSFKFFETDHKKYLVFIFLSFFLALLSKENAITFIAVIPLSLFYFSKNKPQQIIITLVPVFLSTALYVIIRWFIYDDMFIIKNSSDLMNNPFLNATVLEKYATIFYVLGKYISLLIFPHPLTYDYYPKHIPVLFWSDIRVITALCLYISMAVYASMTLKKKSVISYCILFFLCTVSISSNFFFTIGTFMGERFLFFPSFGYSLFLSYFVLRILPEYPVRIFKQTSYKTLLTIILLVMFSFKTIHRNTFWKNNYTLFKEDITVSHDSAKANNALGVCLLDRALKETNETNRQNQLRAAINYLARAIDIYPDYWWAYYEIGRAYYEYNRDYQKIIHYYSILLKEKPKFISAYKRLLYYLGNHPNKDECLEYLGMLNGLLPGRYEINYNMGLLFGRHKRDFAHAIQYLKEASRIKPESVEAHLNLGIAYKLDKQLEEAANALLKAHQLAPDDANLTHTLADIYAELNDQKRIDSLKGNL